MLNTVVNGIVQRLKGTPRVDGTSTTYPARMGRYQEQITQPIFTGLIGMADEGSVFTATNPTLDSAIAVTTSITTYAETAGAVGVALMLRNGETTVNSATAKRIIPLFLKLQIVQVPTSATSWKAAWVVDDNPVRYTSGGSQITTIYNVNGDVSNSSVATMYFGALTTAVPTNKRYVDRSNMRGVIPTTFDQYMFSFGYGGIAASQGAAASGILAQSCAPVVLAPQQNLCLTMWGASNGAAPTFEFTMCWAER